MLRLVPDRMMTLTVANIITSFNSASGGPPRTVALIAQAGIDHWRAELFTTDALGSPHDTLLTDQFRGHVTLLPASNQRMPRSALMYLGVMRPYEAQLLHSLQPDVVHIHGMWSLFLASFVKSALRNRIPFIVAPHGMLEPWSLSVHRWRKSIALRTYQGQILARAAAIHATSETEAENIRRLPCVRAPIFVIPNAVEEPRASAKPRSLAPGMRVLLFLSRIHPKKGLDMLLHAWSQLRPPGWSLLIVGDGEPSYVAKLKAFCTFNHVPNVEFRGHVDGDAREEVFESASALVLPTYSENFGNVVAEAMVRGLAVLTTTGTPWSVVATQKLGWYFGPNVDELHRALAALVSTTPLELQTMGERGRRYAMAELAKSAVQDKLLSMYESVASGRRR
jgi:glycosyltransferase involved in cell wall biosynthesis